MKLLTSFFSGMASEWWRVVWVQFHPCRRKRERQFLVGYLLVVEARVCRLLIRENTWRWVDYNQEVTGDSPGPSEAMADKRSKLTTGPDSGAGAQPTGGLAGGEMRNCLTGGGIWRNCWEFLLMSGGCPKKQFMTLSPKGVWCRWTLALVAILLEEKSTLALRKLRK
jgi:hypothetical protein